jgi:hypothetical protein
MTLVCPAYSTDKQASFFVHIYDDYMGINHMGKIKALKMFTANKRGREYFSLRSRRKVCGEVKKVPRDVKGTIR